MNKSYIATVSIFILLLFASANANAEGVTITVNNINPEKGGQVKIGIFDLKGFPVVDQEIVGVNLKADKKSVTHIFKNLPSGQYSISVFQDYNSNNQLDKNFFGAPTELYGFSTNQYGWFGPPNFQDVSFEVKENTPISLSINLE